MPANIVPDGLRREFGDPVLCGEGPAPRLTEADEAFLQEIRRRFPGAPFFHLKLMIKVAQHRAIFEAYRPEALIVCSEYSFTSSLQRLHAERNGVELINAQHGENFFYIQDAFFHFDRCYVWNEDYARTFQALRAAPGQFTVEAPPSLRVPREAPEQRCYDHTYYLSAESGAKLERIHGLLLRLQKQGLRVAVRPHPRYSKAEEVRALFSDMDVEDCREVSIEASLGRTEHAVAIYSAVLQQAFHSGIPFVIDDLSDPQKYRKLSELHYALLGKESALLSRLLAEAEKEGRYVR
jgi:hypothetical protein